MKTNFEKVVDFNNCFSHKVSKTLYENIFSKEPKLVDLRLKLIKEEIDELHQAFKIYDIVEIIDALADILYVVYGLCAAFGINIDVFYRDFIVNNLQQNEHYKISGNLTNFELTQLLVPKNDNLVLKNFIENCKNLDYKNDLLINLKDISEYYDKIELGCYHEDFEMITEYILLLIRDTYSFGLKINVNLNDAFNIVHNSNMTKICDNEELAKETVSWYLSKNKVYDSPIYKETEYGYIIMNDSTGKILKSIKYTPANFSSLLI